MSAAPEPVSAIRMEDVHFRYPEARGQAGGFELSVPELTIESGECVAVVGPSGSGKTTLMHLAAGIVVPERGRVRSCGVDVASLDDAGRRGFRVEKVGYVFQSFELLDYLDVLDNVLLPYRINPAISLDAEAALRAEELAARLGIADKLRRRPAQLSHGEQQRAAVCRALVTRPGLILADEPTGNLDVANKHRVLAILLEQAKELGATLVTVTHDLELLEHFERVIDFQQFLETGRETGA
jgi:putative ABC transport system ATP-binding protein